MIQAVLEAKTCDPQPIAISVFAAAYGLDLGLEKAGFQPVSLVEIGVA